MVGAGLPENNGNAGQCYNPAFVHAIAIPDADMLDKTNKICVVAKGDGVVDVINIESELNISRSKSTTKPLKGSQSTSKVNIRDAEMEILDHSGGKRLHLDYSVGGHTAAASCVAFSMFGERGKYLISGGNDKLVKVWDCSRFQGVQTSINNDLLIKNINLNKKVSFGGSLVVGFCTCQFFFIIIIIILSFYFCLSLRQVNWLCTTPTESENLVVCDTSKVVKVYSIS